MIIKKSPSEIEAMKEAGRVSAKALREVGSAVRPGISTLELDEIAESVIRSEGGIPAFKGYGGFPGCICASVNDEVVHGIPADDVIIKEGDILSVDCGLILDDWQADSAFTVGVGEITPEARKLIDVTEESFYKGIRKAIAGNHLGDIGHAIQAHAESFGYGVVRDLTGHGIGRDMHEDPSVPNFGRPGHGTRLRAGMTLAIEPMIAMGDYHVAQLDDGWTIVTEDGSLCSHYEHTIAINEHGLPELLTYPGYVLTEEAE